MTEMGIPFTAFFQIYTCFGKSSRDLRHYPPLRSAFSRPLPCATQPGTRLSQTFLSPPDSDSESSVDKDVSEADDDLEFNPEGDPQLRQAIHQRADDYEKDVLAEFDQEESQGRTKHASRKRDEPEDDSDEHSTPSRPKKKKKRSTSEKADERARREAGGMYL